MWSFTASEVFLHIKYPEAQGFKAVAPKNGHKAAALLRQLSGNLGNQSLENFLFLDCHSSGKCPNRHPRACVSFLLAP